jgi:maltose-binding protein MalE
MVDIDKLLGDCLEGHTGGIQHQAPSQFVDMIRITTVNTGKKYDTTIIGWNGKIEQQVTQMKEIAKAMQKRIGVAVKVDTEEGKLTFRADRKDEAIAVLREFSISNIIS